jgi:hypothetical protein
LIISPSTLSSLFTTTWLLLVPDVSKKEQVES